eukprot:TRINITY_DN9509_c0_g1_i1.p1 TRINITY_DN9509_c0_g1~~TRINITY_DN9509_c0_g1_i1.p1  ORF type:complete len:114 (-),score=16.61 TRINITY_DN9509_c0_g1_i1:108-449(-)
MGGGAWPFLVRGVICLLNCDNERGRNRTTSKKERNMGLAVPAVSPIIGVIALIINFFIPGLGTALAGCLGSDGKVCFHLIIGLLQFLLTFLLIGWIWGLIWGVWMILQKSEFP